MPPPEATLGLAVAIDEVVLPAMREIGRWWEVGRWPPRFSTAGPSRWSWCRTCPAPDGWRSRPSAAPSGVDVASFYAGNAFGSAQSRRGVPGTYLGNHIGQAADLVADAVRLPARSAAID